MCDIKQTSAAFTGYRTSKMPFDLNWQNVNAMRLALKKTVDTLCKEGYDTFYSGMCVGADLWAAEAVLEMKARYPHIRLICAIPFEGHDRILSYGEKQQYAQIVSKADEVRVLKGNIPYAQRAKAFNERNIYMLENSSALIAVCDPQNILSGGTANTVNAAKRRNMKILYVNPNELTK